MGHPKFARPKYDTPPHPWKADRIEEEHAIRANHGLKNMTEIWKAKSALRRILVGGGARHASSLEGIKALRPPRILINRQVLLRSLPLSVAGSRDFLRRRPADERPRGELYRVRFDIIYLGGALRSTRGKTIRPVAARALRRASLKNGVAGVARGVLIS